MNESDAVPDKMVPVGDATLADDSVRHYVFECPTCHRHSVSTSASWCDHRDEKVFDLEQNVLMNKSDAVPDHLLPGVRRRLMAAKLQPDTLVAVLSLQPGMRIEVVSGHLPLGVKVHRVGYDVACDAFVVIMEHESFPETNPGEYIPMIQEPQLLLMSGGD